jgi:hypothetical protein
MQALRDWSFGRLLLVSVAWMLGCVLAFVAYLLYQFRELFDASSGSGGVGAVSIGLSLLVVPAALLLPPIVLTAAWGIARRSRP